MRRAASICLLLALAFGGFAWWGLFTVGGRQSFDEMDGLIPVASGVLSALLTICAVITWGFSRARRL